MQKMTRKSRRGITTAFVFAWVLGAALQTWAAACLNSVGFPGPNSAGVGNIQVVSCDLPFTPIDVLERYYAGVPYLFVTQENLCRMYFFNLNNPMPQAIGSIDNPNYLSYVNDVNHCVHSTVMTNSGRIFFTDKENNNIGEIQTLANAPFGSSAYAGVVPLAAQPDGLAYSPALDRITVVVNSSPFSTLWDVTLNAGLGTGGTVTLIGTLPQAEFIDHISYAGGKGANANNTIYLSGYATGNFWRFDRGTGTFCVMNTAPSGGVDGVATYVGPEKPQDGIYKGAVFNHNNGSVYSVQDQAPCTAAANNNFSAILQGGTRGDGVGALADGYYYATQAFSVTRFTIDPKGPASEHLADEAVFVEPGSSTPANLTAALLAFTNDGNLQPAGFADALDVRAAMLLKALKAGNTKRAITALKELRTSVENGLTQGHFSPESTGQKLLTICDTMQAELAPL
jgi:hypothetical protein